MCLSLECFSAFPLPPLIKAASVELTSKMWVIRLSIFMYPMLILLFFYFCLCLPHIYLSHLSTKFMCIYGLYIWRSAHGLFFPDRHNTFFHKPSRRKTLLSIPGYWATTLLLHCRQGFLSHTYLRKDRASQAAHPPRRRSENSLTCWLTSNPSILTVTSCWLAIFVREVN